MIQLAPYLTLNSSQISNRDISHFDTDKKKIEKLLQMALEVKLLKIPSDVSGMYSIDVLHQVSKDSNQDAFIEEILHLQIAASLCNTYSSKKSTITSIIDFKEKFESLNEDQIKLFLAIESSSLNRIEAINKYKQQHMVPFIEEDNLDGIMFGSISSLYISIIMYLLIEYKDGSQLYKTAFKESSIQRDHFNGIASEAPNLKIETILRMISSILDQSEEELLYALIFNIIKQFKEQGVSPDDSVINNLLGIKFENKDAVAKYHEIISRQLKKDPSNERLLITEHEIFKIRIWLEINNQSMIDLLAFSPNNRVNN